jgi:rhodanese-related sulfurtransferase
VVALNEINSSSVQAYELMKSPASLLTAALLLFSATVCFGQATSPANTKNISAAEFDQKRQTTNTVVLDVRTPGEYAENRLPGAVLIDFNAPDFEKKIAALDKSKTYLVHCAVGGRSAKACDKMAAMGFTNVYNLSGGLKGWIKEGKPVSK